MKLLPILLAASLVANAALIGLLVAGARSGRSSADQAGAALRPDATRAQAEAPAATWSDFQNENLAAQIERLRAEEFSPAMIRAIVSAQVRERFATRRAAIEATAETAFWLPPNSDPATRTALFALDREERKTIADLLGPDPENGAAARLQRQFPDWSPAKIEQLAQINERYDEQRAELLATMGSGPLADRSKIDALAKTMHQEFAGVLSPQELEEFDLRASQTANQLRYTLQAFNATEQEFRALYTLQSAFDEQNPPLRTGMSQEQMRARTEAQRILSESISATLGAERYAEYQRATDFNYRRTTQLVARLELPPETANEIYAVQQDIQRRAAALRSVQAPDRLTQLTALAAEAETKIAAKLGPRGFEAYKQNGATWLQNLAPRPPPPPPR
jgi:hypothetical protein